MSKNTIRKFWPQEDRYLFDCNLCPRSEGWKQYDTDQDAPYFGIWIHPEEFKVVTYAEGDVTIEEYSDRESFREGIQKMNEFYGSPPPAAVAIAEDGTKTELYDKEAAHGRDIPG